MILIGGGQNRSRLICRGLLRREASPPRVLLYEARQSVKVSVLRKTFGIFDRNSKENLCFKGVSPAFQNFSQHRPRRVNRIQATFFDNFGTAVCEDDRATSGQQNLGNLECVNVGCLEMCPGNLAFYFEQRDLIV